MLGYMSFLRHLTPDPVERLLVPVIRSIGDRLMHFEPADGDVGLPAPGAGRRYMLYLHVPFCTVLCPFCTFHRVAFEADICARYYNGLRSEVQTVSDRGYVFDEVYIGGGTPTVMPDELLALITWLRETHPVGTVSVETNPDHLQQDRVTALANAGVNRLSVGVQSFDDTLLRRMSRYDAFGSGEEIAKRLKAVAGLVDTINVDMIFNQPEQTAASLRRDLDILVDDIAVDQVSFYPLMVTASSRRHLQAAMGEHDTSRQREYYELIAERMTRAGYIRGSAWCFSKKAGAYDEYVLERDEYVGLGSGAFSYLDGGLYASTFSIPDYLARVEAGRTGTERQRQLPLRDQMRYLLLMRLFGGSLDLSDAEACFDGSFEAKIWPELAALTSVGAIERRGSRLQLTERGYAVWIVLMREFFATINNLRDELRRPVGKA
ncbi:MAG: coproporphyrinogen III oxidase family protein [Woeseiaceae bacterium]|nr:coproporphyrinogen III oxidase family protein [Woeseiaceae bacterium]